MFVAPPSREDRRDVLLQAVRDIHFAAVVVAPGGVFASSHLPLLVKETGNGDVLLEGHVSRANDLWRQSRDTPALAIFQGPQAYIHPGWYPSKQRDGRAVPTWNYIAVHLTGVISANEDETWLRRHLEELTATNVRARGALGDRRRAARIRRRSDQGRRRIADQGRDHRGKLEDGAAAAARESIGGGPGPRGIATCRRPASRCRDDRGPGGRRPLTTAPRGACQSTFRRRCLCRGDFTHQLAAAQRGCRTLAVGRVGGAVSSDCGR